MSDLRQDLVSRDWIIMAPERISRPHDFIPKKKKRKPSAINVCPFEDKNLRKSTTLWPPILSYPKDKNWEVVIIPNKYPALTHYETCAKLFSRGPYQLEEGVGHHDLVITRDHNKDFSKLTLAQAFEVLKVFQKHYLNLKKDPCLLYASIFFNWGEGAGATIYHPHYQFLTLPIIPPDVHHSLYGSNRYYHKHRKCPHCGMIEYELKEKRRILEKNAGAVAFAPFFSRQPFEMRVFPRKHYSYFERTSPLDLRCIAEVMQKTIKKMSKNLNDPDFNFFIHTAPFRDRGRYSHYHWHIEIIPKIAIQAGFELSTGVEINVVDPDQATAILCK